MLRNKRHSWSPVLFTDHEPQFYKHYKCQQCDLEKATVRVGHKYTTFYFESNGRGKILKFGLDYLRVPYGCGEIREMLLEDDLFEI
jgi:hypothetical protein